MGETKGTDKCYLTFSDEIDGGGYLTCTYNHPEGEDCLANRCQYCSEIRCKCYEDESNNQ